MILKEKKIKKRPRMPNKEPQTDYVNWNQRIFKGDLRERLLAVFEAKEKRAAKALPALAEAMKGTDEVSKEAFDAAEAVIKHNPGDMDILGMAASLDLSDYDSLRLFSAIAEANPEAQQCSGRSKELIQCVKDFLSDKMYSRSSVLYLKEAARTLGFLNDTKAIGPLENLNTSSAALAPQVHAATTMSLWQLYQLPQKKKN